MAASWKDSPKAWRLLRFLKRKPAPAKVIGESDAGDDVVVAITGADSAQWSDAIGALRDCWTVKALDKDGNTLRVLELDRDDPELAAEDDRDRPTRSSGIIAVDVPKLVDNIARNMREVASSAAAQQSKAFSDGFAAMTSVVNLALQLLVRVEQRLEVAEERHQATAPDDGRQQLAMLALQRALGGAQPVAPAPTNGGNGSINITPQMINQLLEQFMTPGNSEGDGHAG